MLSLLNISSFSSTNCLEVMSKRTQEDAGEERVTAKSKPMMNLVSRCSVRDPNVLASTASESLVKTRHESQNPLSPQTEKYDRTERPVVCAHSSSYSEWNVDKTWSYQEWKSDELMEDRTVRPVYEQPAVLFTQHIDSSWYDGEAINDFWFISGNFIYRHHLEPRVKLYVPTEKSFPISLEYIDVSWTPDTNSDVMSEKHIEDYWSVDGERELTDAWTGFTILFLPTSILLIRKLCCMCLRTMKQ